MTIQNMLLILNKYIISSGTKKKTSRQGESSHLLKIRKYRLEGLVGNLPSTSKLAMNWAKMKFKSLWPTTFLKSPALWTWTWANLGKWWGRDLEGFNPWGHKESDTTGWLNNSISQKQEWWSNLYKEASCQRHHKNGLLLPRWLSGKESACQAGDMGLIPDPEDPTCHGTNPCITTTSLCSRTQVLQLLGPRAAITEPQHPRSHVPQEKPQQWEARGLQLENSPHLRQLEKAHVQQWRSGTAKNK